MFTLVYTAAFLFMIVLEAFIFLINTVSSQDIYIQLFICFDTLNSIDNKF